MIDPDAEREEEANAERTVEGEEAEREHGILGTIERAFGVILSPLTRQRDSEADIEARRIETDAEERK